MRKFQFKSAIAVVLAGIVATSPLAAGPVTIRIPYGDLDISQPAGFEALQLRIKAAAERACRYGTAYSGLLTDERCVADATEAALAIARKRVPEEVAVNK